MVSESKAGRLQIAGILFVVGTISFLIVASNLGSHRERATATGAKVKEPLGSYGEAAEPQRPELLKYLQVNNLVTFGYWQVGDREEDRLRYLVNTFDKDARYMGAGQKLSIFDSIGKIVYEDRFKEVHKVYSIYALRDPWPQLVFEVDHGGSSNFFEMLDYRDGKIVDLMEKIKPNNDFDVDATISPQLKSVSLSAREPYEIRLTAGVGLASPAEKRTRVFRYMRGKYAFVGDFPTKTVEDYIEELLTQGF